MRIRSGPPLLPPRVRDWKKGQAQVGAFLRTENGSVLQMANDTATRDQVLLVLAVMRGDLPEEAIAPLRDFIQGTLDAAEAEKKKR